MLAEAGAPARRLLSGLRLAPRSYVVGLLNRRRPDEADRAAAAALRTYFGPPPAGGEAGHLLLASYQPLAYSMKMEGLFARALAARGWRVSVLAADAAVPLARLYHGEVHGFRVVTLTEFASFRGARETARRVEEFTEWARSDIAAFKRLAYRDVPVGLHALATLSSLEPEGRLVLDGEKLARLRRLLRQSMHLVDAADRLFDALRPTLVLGIEKGFVTTCEAYYTAARRGIDYVQWVGCHEPESVMLKRYGPHNLRDHPFSVSDATWRKLLNRPWTDRVRDAVMAEFERGYNEGTWFQYKRLAAGRAPADAEALRQRLGLDPAKPTAVIYAHILSDANLFYGEDLFPEGFERWLVETVRAAGENDRVNWVIKLHPANVFRNAGLGYAGEFGEIAALRRAFGQVPGFLKVVPPDDPALPSSFFAITGWGLTVRGTIGLELPCFGIPVLTAGTGRYSGKGFTVDSRSPGEYLERVRHIDRIPRLDDEQRRRALLHAYLVFRLRPAKYDALAKDVYNSRDGGARERDIALQQPSFDIANQHEQMRRIADFLVHREREDFLAPAPELASA
jgi:hypothetical protein